MAVALALGVSLGVSMFNPVMPTTQVEASSYNYSADQLRALSTLNKLRAEAGMKPVKLDPFLTKAATNHYAYLNTNGHAFGHDEVKGHKGFTGVSPKDRVKAVGGSVGDKLGENIVFGTNLHSDGVTHLVHEAPLHRETLLNPDLQSVGFEVEKGNPKGMHVIVARVDKYEQRDTDHVYPIPNMKDVNPLFGGREIPDPLKDYGIDQSGHILTYWYPSEAFIYEEKDFSFVLKDSKGAVVPAFVDFKRNQASRLIPKKELKYGEKYTATVKWYSPDNDMTGGRTWSFTTATQPPDGWAIPPATSVKESKDYTLIKGQPLYEANITKSIQLAQIPAGAKVRSIEKRGSWMKVTYSGKTGWVAVNNLKAYVVSKQIMMYANKATKAYTTRSTKGKVAFNISSGGKVTRLGVNGSWSQVKVGTKTGWVASRDLSASAPVVVKAVEMMANKKATVYTTRSTKGKVAFTVPAKAKVTRLAVNASWSQIKYNGKTGWVASSSLSAIQIGAIKTQYGSHTYGVNNQAEYDAVMKVVKEEFAKNFNNDEFGLNAHQQRVLNGERGNWDRNAPNFRHPDNIALLEAEESLSPYFTGDLSLDAYTKIGRANNFYRYIIQKYNIQNVDGDARVNSAYNALIQKKLDCDAGEQLKSAIYDMAGIDNAVIGDGVTHAVLIFKLDGKWMGSGLKGYTKEEVASTNALNLYLSYTQSGKKISY